MGTVHGCYLKYVALSGLSYAGYSLLAGRDYERHFGEERGMPIWAAIPTLALGWSALLNGTIAVLFKLERGMGMLGKDYERGQIPLWSYVLYFPFHIPNQIYTYYHTVHGKQTIQQKEKAVQQTVPVASPLLVDNGGSTGGGGGWWLGGSYSYLLNRKWSCVVDLTSEFPENCIDQTKSYILRPTWDGVPPTPAQLHEITTFVDKARQQYPGGDVLVHCAHGRGRSTTVMAACLVQAGLYSNWKEAFDVGIKPYRPVAKLNKRMQQNLTAWQEQYVDNNNNNNTVDLKPAQ